MCGKILVLFFFLNETVLSLDHLHIVYIIIVYYYDSLSNDMCMGVCYDINSTLGVRACFTQPSLWAVCIDPSC